MWPAFTLEIFNHRKGDMELIKQIKEAEAQAKDILEQAKAM